MSYPDPLRSRAECIYNYFVCLTQQKEAHSGKDYFQTKVISKAVGPIFNEWENKWWFLFENTFPG